MGSSCLKSHPFWLKRRHSLAGGPGILTCGVRSYPQLTFGYGRMGGKEEEGLPCGYLIPGLKIIEEVL